MITSSLSRLLSGAYSLLFLRLSYSRNLWNLWISFLLHYNILDPVNSFKGSLENSIIMALQKPVNLGIWNTIKLYRGKCLRLIL